MARNYAALKHDYLLEMEELTDAEFGRLCRELLRYSIDGTESQMKGNERFFWNRVKMQEKRAKESYDELCRHARNPGKRVAVPKSRRKQAKAKKSKKTKWFLKKAKETKPKQTKAKKANTKRNTNTNTKTIVYPLSGEDYTRTRAKAPPAGQKQWPITASISTPHRLGTHCRRWNALRASWAQR